MERFNDKATLHNAELVKVQLASLPSPRTAAGTYKKYAGYGQWSKLTLLPRAQRQFDLELSEMRYGLVFSAAEYGPAAVWNLDASAMLQGQVLVVTYLSEDAVACHFTANVTALSIVVEQQEMSPSCLTGGYNTFPSGVFWRVEPL
jgi:hypothetical protein